MFLKSDFCLDMIGVKELELQPVVINIQWLRMQVVKNSCPNQPLLETRQNDISFYNHC